MTLIAKKMTRHALAALVLLALATTLAAAQEEGSAAKSSGAEPASGATGPMIQFATPTYDFGKVLSGEVIYHDFIFTNIGDQTLEITNVKPSCGCTTAGDYARKIEPGQKGKIPLKLNTQRFKGPLTKTATITSNSIKNSRTTLKLRGTVWQPLEITPAFLNLGMLPTRDTVRSKTIKVKNNLDEPIYVTKVEAIGKGFSAELKTIEEGQEYEVVVSTQPPLQFGSTRAQIAIHTSYEKKPKVMVSATAIVQKPILVSPTRLMLPAPPSSKDIAKSVTIRKMKGDTPLVISNVEVTGASIEARLKEITQGKNFKIFLNFPAGFEIAQGQKAILKLKTNHPDIPDIEVPITQITRRRTASKPAVPARGSGKKGGTDE